MIHLRLRTEYSFGKTFAPVNRVVERLESLGVTAAGIVDHSTWGHVAWHKACTAAGIKPLLGVELAVNDEDTPQRMWFLAKNQAGLAELYRFTSRAHRQPIRGRFGSVPRLYLGDVEDMSDNVWKFAGDILDKEFLLGCGAVLDLNPASRTVNRMKRAIAQETGLMLVNTADNAYANLADKETFELASNAGLKMTPQHIVELPEEESAARIAESCESYPLPQAPMVRTEGDLEVLCRAGIEFRGMQERWTEQYEERLQYELELIRSKDFESYFLIVADMVHYAKQHMLVGPSRGSAAGSLVCYLARITEIDPIPPKLYFERFIDVSRTDLPDIDLDFPDNKRHLVFEYMAEKYGANNVAHIGNVNRFKPKSALIQVCKALNIPPAATAAVKVAMIERSSADSRANNCLEDTMKETEPGKAFMRAYPEASVASLLEGHASHTGVHAAGLLVSNTELTDYATIDANGVAHIDKHAAEALGLLKIDVLGLRTLGILEDAGVPIPWYDLPFDDEATYDIFNNGRMCGIFQFEGNALRTISRDIDFKTITEIDAVTALARPGPFGGGVTEKYVDRKKGAAYKPLHPLVEEHMKETYGLPVYQEQTLAIVREIGRFDWKETSTIRKAMSKRMGKEFFETYWDKFRSGAESQGISESEARTTWEMINAMGAWQMNKCTAEGTLVRITANNAGVPIWCPIEDLYEKYIESPSSWIKQNKSMPRLLSLFPDGKGRPQRALNMHKNGEKECVELVFSDGSKTRCTPDHKFIINGEWTPCGDSSIGDKYLCLRREQHGQKPTRMPAGKHTGRRVAIKNFKAKMKNRSCEDCGERANRMEIHHNDHNYGLDRKDDLAWLCSSCHKMRHKKAGDWETPFDAGHIPFEKELISVRPIGMVMTYDIEMPDHHNYVIDGGLVTHNSHTFSYAVISYWTAYLKAHHPLAFAAANLRSAKDEDSATELLREMVREGIEYVPFDVEKSELNWCVKDGKLYGGFTALKGIGESKASKLIEARNAHALTAKQRQQLADAFNVFEDLFPFHNRYGHLYENPRENGIIGGVSDICDLENIPHGEERVFLGELIYKNARNANEEVNVKKRGGRLETGPLEFVDLRLRDDTGMIGGRIGRFDYQRIGKELLETVPTGSHLLVRAKFWNGIRYAFIQKYKLLDGGNR